MRKLIGMLVGALALVTLAGVPPAAADGKATATAVWTSATYAPGSAQNWHWVATPDAVYDVGLTPQGASTTVPCQMEVTRDWYLVRPDGVREYWWTVKNVGTIACATQVLLTARNYTASLGAYTLDPGGSISKEWNINLSLPVFVAGAAPAGATPSTACQMEVTRSWFTRETPGSIHMYVTMKNVGTIACSAKILFTNLAAGSNYAQTATILTGSTYYTPWNNLSGPTTARWTAITPGTTTGCALELTRKVYAQVFGSAGMQRQLRLWVKNVGGVNCSGKILFTSVAA